MFLDPHQPRHRQPDAYPVVFERDPLPFLAWCTALAVGVVLAALAFTAGYGIPATSVVVAVGLVAPDKLRESWPL